MQHRDLAMQLKALQACSELLQAPMTYIRCLQAGVYVPLVALLQVRILSLIAQHVHAELAQHPSITSGAPDQCDTASATEAHCPKFAALP
jgi:hypothetical protein